MAKKENKLSTESYKGVRDFYPKDLYIQNYITGIMAQTAERFGYSEYSASILEPSELYEAKTGDEIVREQTYTFKDRGGRRVTLRPEITPSVARMVAAKKRELNFPLRWYSIPNLFRYERPQKGRLREHFQLNVDIFGVGGIEADVEIIQMTYQIMKNFGAIDTQFKIFVSSRKLINRIYTFYGLRDEEQKALSKLIDKRSKITPEAFRRELDNILSQKEGLSDIFFELTDTNDLNKLPDKLRESKERKELDELLARLNKLGIDNIVVDTSIMRGLDYYTGIVFEVYDTGPENKRSLLGGGRYDELLEIFNVEGVPAVGFGMGDVVMRNFLETYNLLPTYNSVVDLYICTLSKEAIPLALDLSKALRSKAINVAIDYTGKKVGDQLKWADKESIPFAVCVGDDEIKSRVFAVKNMQTGKVKELKEDKIAHFIKGAQHEKNSI